MASRPSLLPGDYPAPSPMLEEAAAARGRDRAASIAFALSRMAEERTKLISKPSLPPFGLSLSKPCSSFLPGEQKKAGLRQAQPERSEEIESRSKPAMLVLPLRWISEHGRPCAAGIGSAAIYLATPPNAAEALWAIEQSLRSGAFAGVIGAVDGATLTQTRRLDFAAKLGETPCILLTSDNAGLSAARRRWRIAAAPSAPNPYDAQAPGALRVHAELVRRRDGPPGAWLLEMDDETNRLRLADRLRHNGLVDDGRTRTTP